MRFAGPALPASAGEAARTLLAKGLPLKTIAGKVGLTSSARLGQAFGRRFGMAPSLFREMHRAA